MSTDHTPVVLFAEVEIVSALPDEEVVSIDDALFCACCGYALSEETIEMAEGESDLCGGCFEDASYDEE